MHAKSVVEQVYFHEFAFDNEALKHSLNIESGENIQRSNVVEFELRHIPSIYIYEMYHHVSQYFVCL